MDIPANSLKNLKRWVIRHWLAYDERALRAFLDRIGVRASDTLMVHSSWRALNGFQGTPAQFCAALRESVGESGLVVMPSLTYQNQSSAEFLAIGKPMDVRRSPSAMGLLSEVFRRGKGVVRSLSPTHPLLAWGHDAAKFIAGHEQTDRPFGPDSPFSRLLERDALILCVDTGFESITFTHYVEDRFADTLAVPLYEPEPMPGTVIDREGNRIDCPTRVLSREANRLRREARLIDHLQRNRLLLARRLGNTRFTWIRATDLLAGAEQLVASGLHFFDAPVVQSLDSSATGHERVGQSSHRRRAGVNGPAAQR
ncbi:aminoglycoside 3-N-acetyltransferase [Allochromatium vinosum DSM 180]|uniref:Aminoglycoside N(3)-acetyltransferase n=1 Tax=Allochromatium vinosum (strain ATCC 17899 / DSM 180 / NBRC 103801 / NCIMB 10441 / D) TaxID=572477 RepID=D3RU67_ALLVD|nr:aminoglycoside 3-N-acetyltransferase [Allochromatium vinosum DSM 180]